MSGDDQERIVDEADRALLQELLEAYLTGAGLPEITAFRIAHREDRQRLDDLRQAGLIVNWNGQGRYGLTLAGLFACDSPAAKKAHQLGRELIPHLQRGYVETPSKTWSVEEFAARFLRPPQEVSRILTLFVYEIAGISPAQFDQQTWLLKRFMLSEPILDATLPNWPEELTAEPYAGEGDVSLSIERIEISGYRPFSNFAADLKPLTVILGANAAGKSSLFDALRLLSSASVNPIPPEIDPRADPSQTLFHAGGPERIDLSLTARLREKKPLRYEVSILGPVGAPRISRERLALVEPGREGEENAFVLFDFAGSKGVVRNPRGQAMERRSVAPNELALRRAFDPALRPALKFQTFVASWGFYGGFDVSPRAAMRRPVPIEQNPVLAEDGANLSAVLSSLVLEHREAWEELETALRAVIPGFESISVKPRGNRGMAIGVWRERGVKEELSLVDLSEGTLRLLCWLSLALSPNLPPVVCIDEPELGLHPRVLPTLAGMFKVASARSQLLIATHSPHFLSHFDLEDIAVMRKEDGRAVLVRPATSEALRREVEEVGGDVLARLFLSEELEVLP
jgi:predicted ATPase